MCPQRGEGGVPWTVGFMSHSAVSSRAARGGKGPPDVEGGIFSAHGGQKQYGDSAGLASALPGSWDLRNAKNVQQTLGQQDPGLNVPLGRAAGVVIGGCRAARDAEDPQGARSDVSGGPPAYS